MKDFRHRMARKLRRHNTPAVILWQMKGTGFPRTQVLPNNTSQSTDNFEFEAPESFEENQVKVIMVHRLQK